MVTIWKTSVIFIGIISILIFTGLFGCGIKSISTPDQSSEIQIINPTFKDVYDNVLKDQCVSCHTSRSPILTAYTSTMASGSVVAYSPESSSLYQAVLNGTMPKGMAPLSPSQIELINIWITSGAPSEVPIPPTPTGLSILDRTKSEIEIQWSDSSHLESAFLIERSTDQSTFVQIAEVLADISTFRDSGLNFATTYYYRIKSKNEGGPSEPSLVLSATTKGLPPNAPTNFTISPISDSQLKLIWEDNSTNEVGFTIQRGDSANGTFVNVITTSSNTLEYTDSNLIAARTYFYKIYAINNEGDSSSIGPVSGTTTQTPVESSTPPSAPSNLSVNTANSSQLSLSWQDNSNDEANFKIYRSTSVGGTYTIIATLGVNLSSFQDTALSASTAYYYKVSASNSSGESALTAVATATTASPPPSAPSSLAVSAISDSILSLSWTDNSSNESGFKIESSSSASGPFSLLATVGTNVTSYAHSNLSSVTTVYYRIFAYSGNGNSSFTTVIGNTTWGTFTWISSNILNPSSNSNKCNNCHSGAHPPKNYNTSTYSDVMVNVISGNASGSLMYQRILDGTMPQAGPLTATEIKAVETWINGGAQNN